MPFCRQSLVRRFSSTRKKKYDAVIIGGGHNGLVAAAYLQKHGFQVCVMERRHQLGGATVTEEIIPGFRFSRASYVLSLFRPQIYTDLNLKAYGLKVHPRNPSSYTPLRQEFWKGTARSLTLGMNRTHNRNQIAQFSLKDAEAFAKYESHMEALADAVDPLFDISPAQVARLLQSSLPKKALVLMQSKDLRKAITRVYRSRRNWGDLFELMTSPPHKYLSQWFQSEPLIATLATDAVIGSMTSPLSPGTGYVLLHHVMGGIDGVRGSWGYPEGGMGAVSEAIALSAQALGATILTDQTVKRILVGDDGQAIGVIANNSEEYHARVVLSNATPKVTFLDLLSPGVLDRRFETTVQKIDYTSPVTKINVALNRLPDFIADPCRSPNEAAPHHSATIHLNCEDTNVVHAAYQDALAGNVSKRPMIEMVIPSVLDSTLAPPEHHVCLLFTQYTPYYVKGQRWDDQAREDYANQVFSNIEEYAPGFKDSVIGKEVLTPVDLEKAFGLTGGNIFHGSLSPDQLFFQRPVSQNASGGTHSPLTPVPRLLLCGSGAHPGGGVTGAPGRLAALEALRLLKNPKLKK